MGGGTTCPAWCSQWRRGGCAGRGGRQAQKKAGREHCMRWAGATCGQGLGVLYLRGSRGSTVVTGSELTTLTNYLLAFVLPCSIDQIS